VNCRVALGTILAERGVTSRDTNSAGVTVSEALLVMPEKLAVIVAVPTALDVATPLEPVTSLIRATASFDEAQVTDEVISCVDASVNVPLAVNCWVFPSTVLVLVGAITRDTNVA
jgi:hypothetical protein